MELALVLLEHRVGLRGRVVLVLAPGRAHPEVLVPRAVPARGRGPEQQ